MDTSKSSTLDDRFIGYINANPNLNDQREGAPSHLMRTIWVRYRQATVVTKTLSMNGCNAETGYRKHRTFCRRNKLTSCYRTLHSCHLTVVRFEREEVRWMSI